MRSRACRQATGRSRLQSDSHRWHSPSRNRPCRREPQPSSRKLSGKNPEVAIEIQISGNLTEAKDRLAQARKFNYRKVILVITESEMKRLNALMKHEPELRSWMEAWSIGAIYEMYVNGETFFHYYRHLNEAVYKEKKELGLIK